MSQKQPKIIFDVPDDYLIKIVGAGIIAAAVLLVLVGINEFARRYYFEYQSPIILQSPVLLKQHNQPQPSVSPSPQPTATPSPSPTPTPTAAPEATESAETVSYATVTAYSCEGIKTEAERQMNCPNGITATGTTPRPYKTVACDRANLGREFELEGIGTVVCEDTGGAIQGPGRFDLYVEDVQTAREWGKQQVAYKVVKE